MSNETSKNRIYLFSIIPGLILIMMHILCFKVSIPLSQKFAIVNYIPKIPAIDDLIPIVPVFITVYFFAYLFWLICPVLNSQAPRQRYADYIIGFAAAYIIGGIILSLFPATMDRTAEGLYSNVGTDIFSRWHYWFITVADPGEMAHGLLPSFHTMSSVFCYLGVARCKEIPLGTRIFICLYALSVVLSTLFLKQHYVMDMVSGATLACICYALSRKFHWGNLITPVLKKFDHQG